MGEKVRKAGLREITDGIIKSLMVVHSSMGKLFVQRF